MLLKNSYLIYNDAFNIQLYLINNSNELTKAFRLNNPLNYKYSLKLPKSYVLYIDLELSGVKT